MSNFIKVAKPKVVKNTTKIGLLIDADVVRALSKLSEDRGLNFSTYVREVLKNHVDLKTTV